MKNRKNSSKKVKSIKTKNIGRQTINTRKAKSKKHKKNTPVEKSELSMDFQLTKEEVQKKLNSLKSGSKQLKIVIYEFKTKNAEKALGKTWKKFCTEDLAEYGTENYIGRLYRSALIERELDVPIGTLSEPATRNLTSLSSTQLKNAWGRLETLGKNVSDITASDTKLAVSMLSTGEELPTYLENINSQKELMMVLTKVLKKLKLKSLKKAGKKINARIEKKSKKIITNKQ